MTYNTWPRWPLSVRNYFTNNIILNFLLLLITTFLNIAFSTFSFFALDGRRTKNLSFYFDLYSLTLPPSPPPPFKPTLPNVDTTSQGVGADDVVQRAGPEVAQHLGALVLGLKNKTGNTSNPGKGCDRHFACLVVSSAGY